MKLKSDIRPKNKKGEPHGYWIMYYDGTEYIWFKGKYVHGNKQGLWFWYNHNCNYIQNHTKIYYI
jgi:hypothetical protein